MNTLEIIQNKIKEKFGAEVKGETTFKETNIDSLDLVDLVYELEEELNITFEDDEFEGLKTVNDVVTLIDQKRK